MADLFATGIQLPNVGPGVSARDADAGFIRIFFRENAMYGVMSDGTEVALGSGYNVGAAPAGQNRIFTQATDPAQSTTLLVGDIWIQT